MNAVKELKFYLGKLTGVHTGRRGEKSDSELKSYKFHIGVVYNAAMLLLLKDKKSNNTALRYLKEYITILDNYNSSNVRQGCQNSSEELKELKKLLRRIIQLLSKFDTSIDLTKMNVSNKSIRKIRSLILKFKNIYLRTMDSSDLEGLISDLGEIGLSKDMSKEVAREISLEVKSYMEDKALIITGLYNSILNPLCPKKSKFKSKSGKSSKKKFIKGVCNKNAQIVDLRSWYESQQRGYKKGLLTITQCDLWLTLMNIVNNKLDASFTINSAPLNVPISWALNWYKLVAYVSTYYRLPYSWRQTQGKLCPQWRSYGICTNIECDKAHHTLCGVTFNAHSCRAKSCKKFHPLNFELSGRDYATFQMRYELLFGERYEWYTGHPCCHVNSIMGRCCHSTNLSLKSNYRVWFKKSDDTRRCCNKLLMNKYECRHGVYCRALQKATSVCPYSHPLIHYTQIFLPNRINNYRERLYNITPLSTNVVYIIINYVLLI